MTDDKTISMQSGATATGKAFVRYEWGGMRCQFTPEEARQHALGLIQCADAAEFDGCFVRWSMKTLDIAAENAAVMLGDMRNFRAGIGEDEEDEDGERE